MSITMDMCPSLGPQRKKTCLGVCEQHRRRPDCASAQSDQRLCYSCFGKCKLATGVISIF